MSANMGLWPKVGLLRPQISLPVITHSKQYDTHRPTLVITAAFCTQATFIHIYSLVILGESFNKFIIACQAGKVMSTAENLTCFLLQKSYNHSRGSLLLKVTQGQKSTEEYKTIWCFEDLHKMSEASKRPASK